jgi:peptidoglycan lytic transglycosylase G
MRRMTIIAAALIGFTIGSAAGLSVWVYRTVHTSHKHSRANDFIKIEKGSTPRQIITKLAEEGIISNYLATYLYVRLFGDVTRLQAGEYQFDSPITPLQVLNELESGQERTVKLTIPEGFNRFDITKRVVEKFPQDPPLDEATILRLMDDTTLVRDIAPTATNLEGYMYPSTYSVPRDAKPADIIKEMVEQFRKVWKPEWADTAKRIGRTPQEIVTIASLIETESGVEAERATVASVIYNRLNRHMALGIDQTVVYIAKMENRWDGTINQSDLEANSPYNTRKYPGLPPGPISSVSESALNAALHPAETNYLYYVRNVDINDGSHWFYTSAADFEVGKAKYQRWLEEQRKEKRAEESIQQ